MNVDPELIEKKKIIKKVRFHEDDPLVVGPSVSVPE
jgi:hypothetical protein